MAIIKFKKGSGTPSGLTLAEPAFDLANNKFFIGVTGSAIWVGGEVDNNTALGTSQVKIPTQYAVKTYIDNNIAGGAVTAVNGLTGSVFVGAGSFINVAAAGKGITVSNAGVHSVNGSTGAITNVAKTDVNNNFNAPQTISAFGAVFDIVDTLNSAGVTIDPLANTISWRNGLLSAVLNFNPSPVSFPDPARVATLPDFTTTLAGLSGTQTFGGTKTFNALTTFNAGIIASGATFSGNISAPNIVTGITGTANQIVVTGTTGSVSVGFPNSVTMPGSLSVTGNLTVNGTTTYVNSTVTEIADPIITLGWTGGIGSPPVDDNKDRGIAFKYNSSGGKTGFFGYDDSTGYFTFIGDATIASEIVSGAPGAAQFGTVRLFNNVAAVAATLQYDASAAASRTFTFPSVADGTVVAPSDLGTTNFIIKSNGAAAQPTWINPNAAGFTAYAATHIGGGLAGSLPYNTAATTTTFLSIGSAGTILLSSGSAPTWAAPTGITAGTAQTVTMVSDTSDTTCFLSFVNAASNTNQALKYNSNLAYNAATNYLEVNIDGGGY
jgi:hypothetical protein